MNRKEAKKILEAVSSKGLFSALIFQEGLITKGVEERHIYSDANFEYINWLDRCIEACEKHNQGYIAYLNGELYKSNTNGKDILCDSL